MLQIRDHVPGAVARQDEAERPRHSGIAENLGVVDRVDAVQAARLHESASRPLKTFAPAVVVPSPIAAASATKPRSLRPFIEASSRRRGRRHRARPHDVDCRTPEWSLYGELQQQVVTRDQPLPDAVVAAVRVPVRGGKAERISSIGVSASRVSAARGWMRQVEALAQRPDVNASAILSSVVVVGESRRGGAENAGSEHAQKYLPHSCHSILVVTSFC